MKDTRLLAISDLLAQYSIGNFDNPGIELSDKLDEIDSIISGVNMLGEELEATTVSRDFFADIYNTVSNILLVTDPDWNIIDVNNTSVELLGFAEYELHSMNLKDMILAEEEEEDELWKKLKRFKKRFRREVSFFTKERKEIPTDCIWSKMITTDGHLSGYLVVAEDLTDKKNKEREILLNITETQEAERTRVADDLHDSLGQEIASIRLILSGITSQIKQDEHIKEGLKNCLELLDSSLHNIRSICFDLIPSALTQGELIVALEQVIRKLEMDGSIQYVFESSIEKIQLPQPHQIAVYRVFQEFVHNAMKHAKCNTITVVLTEEENEFRMDIFDDGVGFELDEDTEFSGRGLSTMSSRIKALNGVMKLKSQVGFGTAVMVKFKIHDEE